MIHLIAVGKLKSAYAREGADDFARRIQKFARLTTVEIPDSSPEEEGKRILAARSTGPRVVCDLRGTAWSSRDLADHLGAHGATSFIIGGPDGLSDAVIDSADVLLKLSELTLPHELARVLLLEQIYRGFTILRGHPYHR